MFLCCRVCLWGCKGWLAHPRDPTSTPMPTRLPALKGEIELGSAQFGAMERGGRLMGEPPMARSGRRGHGLCHRTGHRLFGQGSHHFWFRTGKGRVVGRAGAILVNHPLTLFPGAVSDFEQVEVEEFPGTRAFTCPPGYSFIHCPSIHPPIHLLIQQELNSL